MRDEIYCGGLISEDYLEHYGRAHDENPPGRGSGRFAYGSGKQPHQNHDDDPKPKKHRTLVVSKKASRKHSENESEEDKEKNSTKESQLKAAREKGEYDLDSMEVIAGDSVFEDKNEKEMLKEYSKYLDDPDKWMKTFDSTDYHKKKVAKYKVSHSDASDEELSRSSGPWKKHKYIRKEGDRYIYPGTGRSGPKTEHAKKVEAAYNDPLFNEYVSTHGNTSAIGADDFYEWKAKREKKNPALETAKKVLKPVTDFYKEREETRRKLMTEGVKKAGELAGSLFFEKNDKTERSMDRHLAKRPLSRNKRVTESNSVGVRRRKKYGSILTGKR